MARPKSNIAGLLTPLLLLLTLQQVDEHAGIRDASAQSDGQSRKTDKMEPKHDGLWEFPVVVPQLMTELSVQGISAPDPANVWIVAREGDARNIPHPIVLHSADEGKTWQKRRLDDGVFPFDIYFIDDHFGWIAGADGLILRSTDAGTTWNRQHSPSDSHLMLLQFVDGQIGWIGGEDGELLRTTDGGGRWQSCKLPGHGWVANEFRGWLNAFSFVGRLHGWFVGDRSKVFETTDGGNTWRSRAPAIESVVRKNRDQILNLTDVHFFNERKGILLADVISATAEGEYHQALLLSTQDAGRSWRKMWALDRGPFKCLNFVSESEGWMTTGFGRDLVHTTDGGRSWLGQDVPGVDSENLITGGLFALRMVGAKLGWASVSVNDFPILDNVVHTIDGGRTWRRVKLEDR